MTRLIMGASLRQEATVHSIQLLRSVAATLVVLFHAQQAFARINTPLFSWETYLFGFGAVGVHIFFVISGFIMVLTSCQPDRPYSASRFFKRRLLRIYPIYWICCVAYIGVHAAIGQPYDLSTRTFIGALLLTPYGAAGIIGPAWTLCFEMYFYLCFGLAMMLGLTRGLIVLAGVFIGLVAMHDYLDNEGPFLSLISNTLLLEFLAGTAIGWICHKGWLPLRWGPQLTAAGIGLFVLSIALGYHRVPSVAAWGIPSAVLVLGLVTWERARGASPMVVRLGRLGDSSYVLYLIHILVITLAVTACLALPSSLVPTPMLAAGLIALIAIALSEAIHRGIERPMLALFSPKRSLFPSRKAPTQQPSELR